MFSQVNHDEDGHTERHGEDAPKDRLPGNDFQQQAEHDGRDGLADVPRGAVQRDVVAAPLREPLRQDAQRRRVPDGPRGGGKPQRYQDDVVVGKDADDQVPKPHQANASGQDGAAQVLDAVGDDAAAHRGDAAADASRSLHHARANRADAQGLHHEGQQHQEAARIHVLHRVGGNERPRDKEVALAAFGPGFLLNCNGTGNICLGHSDLRRVMCGSTATMLRGRGWGCQGGGNRTLMLRGEHSCRSTLENCSQRLRDSPKGNEF